MNTNKQHFFCFLTGSCVLFVLTMFTSLAYGQVRMLPEYSLHPGVMVDRKPQFFNVPVDTSLVFKDKSLWIEVAGDDHHILGNLIRDAFSKQNFAIAGEAETAQATIHFNIRAIFQRNDQTWIYDYIDRWDAKVIAAAYVEPPKSAKYLSVAFVAGNEFKANTTDYNKIFDGFQFYKGTPLFGYMADTSIPGGVYVLTDFKHTESVPPIYHTGIIMEATFTVDGRTHTAKLWGNAQANHLPVVPLLEYVFVELFKPYGNDAPKIRFPKIKDIPAKP